MKYVSVFVLLVVVTAAGVAQPTKDPNGCNMGWAMPPDVDPRNPDIFCLPEFGSMTGVGAQYGNNIWPLGDLNGDSLQDWAIGHNLDTFYHNPPPQIGGTYPREVLIYRGERGRLPDPQNYERVGPTELGSVSWLVASGDWDNSGSIDLGVAIRIIGDTSYGNVGADFNLSSLVVFW